MPSSSKKQSVQFFNRKRRVELKAHTASDRESTIGSFENTWMVEGDVSGDSCKGFEGVHVSRSDTKMRSSQHAGSEEVRMVRGTASWVMDICRGFEMQIRVIVREEI